MMQPGGNKEFLEETVNEYAKRTGAFHKAGQRDQTVRDSRPQIAEGDGIQYNHRRHGDQYQFGAAINR
ncbi:hypothetical protein D3C78_1751300 [compost metagenome]